MKAVAVNQKISAGLRNERITFLDLTPKFLETAGTIPLDVMPDFVHPTAKGSQVWAEAI